MAYAAMGRVSSLNQGYYANCAVCVCVRTYEWDIRDSQPACTDIICTQMAIKKSTEIGVVCTKRIRMFV